MTPNDLSHEEKDHLIRHIKRALEMASARIACYEGKGSPRAQSEYWMEAAVLSTTTTGWKKHGKGI